MRITKKNVVEVDEWDSTVIETYDRPYSLQQQDGCRERGIIEITVPERKRDYENDTICEDPDNDEMGVSFKAWLAKDPKEPIKDCGTRWLELWWQRNFYPSLQMVANDLYDRGIIEAGEYIINIDW